jgi:branched-chain amino acid transport system permease protein
MDISGSTLIQQIINAISLGAIYSLFALGYALVFSVLGVLNLAHSALFMWGAFFGLIAVGLWGFPVWAAFIVATAGAGILSMLLELIAFRPLRRRGAARISQLISSIGAALLLINLAQLVFQQLYGRTVAYFPREITSIPPIIIEQLGGVRISPMRVAILVFALILMILLNYLVMKTRTGQQMRAVAFNQSTASLLGINVSRVYLITFFLAGALGGAAGMFYGLVFGTVSPFLGQEIALLGLTAIVLGGMGSIQGAVLGGFIVAAIQTMSTATIGSDYRDALVFILLFLILLTRPQGLLGQPESTRA